MKVILTGATGMVGEGVLLECLENPAIEEVLMVNRRHFVKQHPKLKELIVPDFFNLNAHLEELKQYDTCFYCAGISSVGLDEQKYTHITYDTTMAFAIALVQIKPGMVFNFISGSHTDSSENGKVMWARVKGKTENALAKLPFKAQYNFRPGLMNPTSRQQNVKLLFKIISALYPVFKLLMPNNVITLKELGLAMINAAVKGYSKNILEVADIKVLAKT